MSIEITMADEVHESASTWQERIEGEWHGRPSVFDHDGNHTGYIKVYRSSVFADGKTTYYMDTRQQTTGPLRNRLEVTEFAFGVIDSDADRIYLGPDFIGAGHPYGALVDAHYYSPAWCADLRTMVHILPDGTTQCYSSLLFDGPTLCTVFNGLYTVAFDYHENPETQARVEAWNAAETEAGPRPHTTPAKQAGRWVGEMEVWGPDQKPVGANQVTITYAPSSLLRARCTTTIEGVVNESFTYDRYRNGNRHTYEGPDLFGNAIAYGRALYTTQHRFGKSWKIKGREFLLDDQHTMSAVWQIFEHDRLAYTTFGVLEWEGA